VGILATNGKSQTTVGVIVGVAVAVAVLVGVSTPESGAA
jgi:hypothetical protein